MNISEMVANVSKRVGAVVARQKTTEDIVKEKFADNLKAHEMTRQKIDEMQGYIQTLKNRCSSLEGRAHDLEDRCDSLETRVQELENIISGSGQ